MRRNIRYLSFEKYCHECLYKIYVIFLFSGSFCETALMIAFIVTSLFSYCLLLLLKCTTVWVWNVLNIKSMISIFLIFCSSTHFYSTNLVLRAYSTSWFFYHLRIKNYNRYRHKILFIHYIEIMFYAQFYSSAR